MNEFGAGDQVAVAANEARCFGVATRHRLSSLTLQHLQGRQFIKY